MTAVVTITPALLTDESTDAELRAVLELLDRTELANLIHAVYAAAGGLH